MSALLWWLIPVGATLLALAWVALRTRPRRPLDTHSSLSDMARFRAAMRRPMPDAEPAADPRRASAPRRPATRRTGPARPSATAVRARRTRHGRDGHSA